MKRRLVDKAFAAPLLFKALEPAVLDRVEGIVVVPVVVPSMNLALFAAVVWLTSQGMLIVASPPNGADPPFYVLPTPGPADTVDTIHGYRL